MTEDDEKLFRAQLRVAFGAANLAVRQMTQVARCLTIAQAAMMRNDADKVFEELSEVEGRLEETQTSLVQMMKFAEDIANAG